MSIDVREYWNFDDPSESEKRFRAILKRKTLSLDEKLEIWAQIARTHSLRRECDQCHQVLDEYWGDAMAAGPRPKACFELERGRAFRTGGDVPKSIPYFQIAAESEAEDLKVDAMHMLAIVASKSESRLLNLEALAVAKASDNPWAQRWQGTLFNNIAWSLFDEEKFTEAAEYFQQALDQRIKSGNDSTIRVAKWSLARCLRATGDLDRALEIQTELKGLGTDGYVDEELGEIYLEQGNAEQAKLHFGQAIQKLESSLGAESDRIKRMHAIVAG